MEDEENSKDSGASPKHIVKVIKMTTQKKQCPLLLHNDQALAAALSFLAIFFGVQLELPRILNNLLF